jgi:DNA-binding NarL/FixJ family response regulator
MERPTHVFVVDDHDAYRRVAAAVIEATPGFVWSGEAADLASALEAIGAANPLPDVVLVDVNLGPDSGLDLAAELTLRHPELRAVLISTLSTDELPPEAETCGAVAFLSKSDLGPTALEAVATGSGRWPA